jgi:hypothetical protein
VARKLGEGGRKKVNTSKAGAEWDKERERGPLPSPSQPYLTNDSSAEGGRSRLPSALLALLDGLVANVDSSTKAFFYSDRIPHLALDLGFSELVDERLRKKIRVEKEERGKEKERGGRRGVGSRSGSKLLTCSRKEEGGRRKEEGGRRTEDGGRRKENEELTLAARRAASLDLGPQLQPSQMTPTTRLPLVLARKWSQRIVAPCEPTG